MRTLRQSASLVLLTTIAALCIATLTTPSKCQITSQTQGREKRRLVSVCDLIKEPAKYSSVIVVVHANVFDGAGHGILLTHEGCDKGLKMLASERVRENKDYEEFEQVFYSNGRTPGDTEISATFEGRFLYRPAEPRLKWVLDVQRITNVAVGKNGLPPAQPH